MTTATLNRSAGIPLKYANRHGLISGETGTGKTVSLMRLAEQFSRAGVPVFVADAKGDIAALARSCPVALLDLFGEAGQPVRTSIGNLGADLLARILELTDTQAGALEIALEHSRDLSIPVHTIADLRNLVSEIGANRESVSRLYGHVSNASLGVVQRSLLRLESQGAGRFFGLPGFDVASLLDPGKVSILAADRLMQSPRVYSAFLLWMLTDLYNRLPEIGDTDQPRLVFFFDEAHLLFRDCPAALLQRIEQTARLIRSKGVGIYFASQAAADVPATIRDQLAHKVEHSRALPVGNARFETMDSAGRPVASRLVRVELPNCSLGPLSDVERTACIPESARPAIETMGSVSAPIGSDMPAWLEIALYAVCAAVVIAVAAAAVHIISAGYLGFTVAAAIGAWLALRNRLGT